ncbi:unnamed protein product [Effrenium voratum]|nr:unnamed protein product [Effrenium voratum]
MEAAEFFWQMLSAVLHLHGQRVVHRDIKLEHFIQAEGGVLKLVDFGHAWPLQPFSSPEAAEAVIEVMVVQELTIPGGAGTSRYIAPEIQDESEVAAHLADRADMWALGVCLHAMLTGRLLPNCGTLTKVASINSAISQVDEGVLSASAHDLLEQLLQLKPENRPTSAAVARHPWLARAAHADLHPVMDLLSHSRFITDLGVIADAKPIRRLFLLVVAHELEDAQTYPYQALFRAMEAQCRGCLTEQAVTAAVQRLANDLEPQSQMLMKVMTAVLCVMGAVDADGSGNIGWREVLAAILLTQEEALTSKQESAFGMSCFRAFDKLSMGGQDISAASLRKCFKVPRAQKTTCLEDPEDMLKELGEQRLSRKGFLRVVGAEMQPELELSDPLPPPKDSRDPREAEDHWDFSA